MALAAALVEQSRTAEAYETLVGAHREAEAADDRGAQVTVRWRWPGTGPGCGVSLRRRTTTCCGFARTPKPPVTSPVGRRQRPSPWWSTCSAGRRRGRCTVPASCWLVTPPAGHLRVTLASVAALVLTGRTAEAARVGRAAVAAVERSGSSALPFARGMAGRRWHSPSCGASPPDRAGHGPGRRTVADVQRSTGFRPVAHRVAGLRRYAQRVSGDRAGAISRLRDAVAQQADGEGCSAPRPPVGSRSPWPRTATRTRPRRCCGSTRSTRSRWCRVCGRGRRPRWPPRPVSERGRPG
ncbi:hypothetical protein NKG94_21275 [Micromonospora sp. M12]